MKGPPEKEGRRLAGMVGASQRGKGAEWWREGRGVVSRAGSWCPGKERRGIAASEVRGQLLFGLLAGHEADLKLKKSFYLNLTHDFCPALSVFCKFPPSNIGKYFLFYNREMLN